MIAPGTRLGAYEIVAPLGAGGMGEVYRARDTRLGRDVAVKVLPPHRAPTPEIRARFEREARVISSLTHPNICTLYDVGSEGDSDYLVMELVEGVSLADRIARGPLPTPEVLRIGMQIADALDKAHRVGIIHRDLKPGNVMLAKSGAKLLDFGLARAVGLEAPAAGPADSPTMSRPLTAEGTIVGTFQYIAPEQLEGKEADARSDIWALGCVLYEMITGKRAFAGKSQASLISAIMSSEPAPIPELAPLSPPALERLVKGCLAKDPDERVQTAHDARLQLQWIAEGGSQAGVAAPVAARRRSRERLAWVALAVAACAAGYLAAVQLQPRGPAKPVIFELTPPGQVRSVDLPRISPDGRRLAFNAEDSVGVRCIWVRRMNSLDAQRLPGTEGASRPFWSPDGRFLAFFSGGKLNKIDIAGGPPITLCEVPHGGDGTWSPRGVILFDGTVGDSVQSVPASGGVAVAATTIDRKRGEAYTAWPQFLPDGRHFLYIAYGAGGPADRTLKVGRLGSRESASLGPAASRVEYALGHLLYVREGALIARPFDASRRRFTGDPFPVAENVETEQGGASARFSTSSDGTLVYRAGGAHVTNQMVWTNRRGERIGTVGAAGAYQTPALSPDGTQVAVNVVDPSIQRGDVWLWDLARNVGTRLTSSNRLAGEPVWSPDGSRVLFDLARATTIDLFVKRVNGMGVDSLLFSSSMPKFGCSWSTDGRWIAYMTCSPAGLDFSIHALSLGDTVRSVPLVTGSDDYGQPAISPDGKWLAFTSNESGQLEVYLQAFPGAGRRWRVSSAGGLEPSWRGDSRELYYLTPGAKMMAVGVEPLPGADPRLSLPRVLFDTPLRGVEFIRNRYVVTRDGQRFLFVAPLERHVGATTVVLDWLGRLEKR